MYARMLGSWLQEHASLRRSTSSDIVERCHSHPTVLSQQRPLSQLVEITIESCADRALDDVAVAPRREGHAK